MNPLFYRVIHSWITHIMIINIITIALGLVIGPLISWDSNILYWLASTIIQGFGALIAIIWGIGLYQRREMNDRYAAILNTANKNLNAPVNAPDN